VIKPKVFLPLNGRVNGEKETKMKIENAEKEKKVYRLKIKSESGIL